MVSQVNLHGVSGLRGTPPASAPQRAPTESFASVLSTQIGQNRDIKVSAHAMTRLRDRNITLGPPEKARIARALDQAEAKGARESLILMDGTALVASVPNRTIITAVGLEEGQDAVFTNIDSAVVVGQAPPLPIL